MPPAARAAFTLDPELGVTVVQSALDVPFVVRAELDDNLGRPLAEAARERAGLPLRWLTDRLFGEHLTYRVNVDRHGVSLPEDQIAARSVGVLEIEFDTRVLAQNFLARSWLLLVTGIARTVVLGLVLAIVTHLLITRPLAQLVDAVEQVDPQSPDRLAFRVGSSHARDELGRLLSALNRLLAQFRAALAQRGEAFDRLGGQRDPLPRGRRHADRVHRADHAGRPAELRQRRLLPLLSVAAARGAARAAASTSSP